MILFYIREVSFGEKEHHNIHHQDLSFLEHVDGCPVWGNEHVEGVSCLGQCACRGVSCLGQCACRGVSRLGQCACRGVSCLKHNVENYSFEHDERACTVL